MVPAEPNNLRLILGVGLRSKSIKVTVKCSAGRSATNKLPLKQCLKNEKFCGKNKSEWGVLVGLSFSLDSCFLRRKIWVILLHFVCRNLIAMGT